MLMQRTIKDAITFSGIGLHTGETINVVLNPAGENEGISFIRSDIPGSLAIGALAENVVATDFATTLGVGKATVSTVEHLMAALYCMGVDNVTVMLDGPELPIMDGSSLRFVELIEATGLAVLEARKKYLIIKKPIKVDLSGRTIEVFPSDDMELTVDYRMDFTHPFLTKQSFSKPFSRDLFVNEIVSARTYGFLEDVEALRANGFAKGGCLSNAVVIGENEILNEEGLRFPDEFVRHKVLDLMGDIALLGTPLIGKILAFRSGHGLNHALVNAILKESSSWEIIESPSDGPFIEPVPELTGSGASA